MKASESAYAPVQDLLAQKQTAEEDGDDATVASIQQQITDLGYQ